MFQSPPTRYIYIYVWLLPFKILKNPNQHEQKRGDVTADANAPGRLLNLCMSLRKVTALIELVPHPTLGPRNESVQHEWGMGLCMITCMSMYSFFFLNNVNTSHIVHGSQQYAQIWVMYFFFFKSRGVSTTYYLIM